MISHAVRMVNRNTALRPVVEALFDEFGLSPTAKIADSLLRFAHDHIVLKRLLSVEGIDVNAHSPIDDAAASRSRRYCGDVAGGGRKGARGHTAMGAQKRF